MCLYVCYNIRLFYIWLPESRDNTLLLIQCRKTFRVFREDRWVRKSGQLNLINMVLKCVKYDDKFPKSNKYNGRVTWSDIMCWCVVTILLLSGHSLDRHYLTVNPACQTAGTFNEQLHSSEGLNTLTVKCFRRRVWETRHSGATGWKLQSHFSDV